MTPNMTLSLPMPPFPVETSILYIILINGAIVEETSLDIGEAIFFQAISKSMLLLMQQHGYSRDRTTSLKFEEFRQSDAHPTEEEVFMQWDLCAYE